MEDRLTVTIQFRGSEIDTLEKALLMSGFRTKSELIRWLLNSYARSE